MARIMSKSDEGMAAREGLLANDPEVSKEVGNLMGIEVEPEVAAAPAPEAPTQPAPEAPAEPVVPDTTDWKAEHEKLKAERAKDQEDWTRQREGMVAALAAKRRERREFAQQTPLTQAQATTAQTQGIALKWNDKGEAFIDPASLAQLRGGDDLERRIEERVNERLAPYEQERQQKVRDSLVADDPARLTPILGELDSAYRWLDALIQEVQTKPFQSITEAVDFIEDEGIGAQFRAAYPHIAVNRDDIREYILSATRPTLERTKTFMKKVADRKFPSAAPQQAAVVAPAFDPPPSPLDPNKPRPHADRGGKAPPNEGNSMERELADITAKMNKSGAWSITDAERERMGWLTKTLTRQRKAS